MNYLVYIEHGAENLQFYLWLRDYVQRFENLPPGDAALAPVWTPEQAEAATHKTTSEKPHISEDTEELLDRRLFGKEPIVTESEVPLTPDTTPPRNPFSMPPAESSESDTDMVPSRGGASHWDGSEVSMTPSVKQNHQKIAEKAFASANVRLQPFTIQPFREEISRVITNYIMGGAPRELNLSAKEKRSMLQALAVTTHPSAFFRMVRTVEYTLRYQSHPNFIRWTICNGNGPRVKFARGLGVFGISSGLLVGALITLSGAGRGWRAFSAVGLVLGVATLIAAWKGMCVVLHGMHHRHLRPWELFDSGDAASTDYEMKKSSFDTISSSNSYEDEPWVAKYEKRNLIRKIFDREVWVQEPALRQIQDTIFVQAILCGLLVAAVAVGIFVSLPCGGFF